MQTISALLSEVRARTPHAVAVTYGDRRIDFAHLDDAARRAARALSELGIGPGDRVALWLPNTPAWLILWLACARLGAITVAVNTRFRSAEVADIVRRSGAKALALWPGFRGIPFLDILGEIERDALEQVETVLIHDEPDAGVAAHSAPLTLPATLAHCRQVAFPALLERPPLDEDLATPDAGANMFTTSGTTRAPKFVLHSHASIATHAAVVARGFGYADDDPNGGNGVLGALPLCGVFGFCQATAALAAGRTLGLMSAFDAPRALRLIDELGVRCLNVTDDMIFALFDATEREHALPSVTACGFAAFQAKPDVLLERARARGLPLVGLYGMSEVQAFYARQPLGAPPEQRLPGGGVPLDPAARVRVRDPDSGLLLPEGETGELELAGPSRMREYFGNAEATVDTLTEDGFVRSGDLGHLTPGGGFVYLARMGDALRLGGFLVSPAEIEALLNEHPAVSGAQVVGIDTERGARPVAFVTMADGAGGFDEAALRAHCAARLAKFKVPDRIHALAEFPTTPSANGSKIRRAELRRIAQERHAPPDAA